MRKWFLLVNVGADGLISQEEQQFKIYIDLLTCNN
jgi:hypothetical protein